MISARFEAHKLSFKIPGGTSRGVLTEKKLWLIYLSAGNFEGIGECSVIPGLTPDYKDDIQYERRIHEICENPQHFIEHPELLRNEPSILFGWETALLDLKNGGNQLLFDNVFTQGKQSIPINGLIWMGTPEFMRQQIQKKLDEGYSCIKMKVGAIDFDTELQLLAEIRKHFGKSEMTLRVDANGAFAVSDARKKLSELAKLDIHSIEQPIAAGQVIEMAQLCREEILPIALDEELIGVNIPEKKVQLLNEIDPQFIILKPGLHGGISGTREWIELAEHSGINWWMTSALESNVGLNAIAQLTGEYPIELHQGLGTGALFTTNFDSRLSIENGRLLYRN